MLSITNSDIETIISRAVNGVSFKVLSSNIEPFATNKCGILGDHFLLSVEVEDQRDQNANGKKTYKFFVKALGDIKKLPKHLDIDVFEEEINFYNEIQPLLVKDYFGEKWSPNCYLAKNHFLVLEDLREQGFIVPPQQTMDENSLKSAAATLARFHACSVMAEVRIGKPLNEAFPTFFSEKICNNNNKFGQAVQLGYKTQILMAEKLKLDASFVLPNVYEYVCRMVSPQKEELNVIGHSDLYKYNIMFNGDNAALILDYQLLRYASPVIDISILLHLNTIPEFRKASDINILKHYYSVFHDTLQQSNLTINIPSYEHMLEMYQKRKIVGMTTSVDYLASLYLNSEIRDKIWNEPEVLEKFLLYNRIDILGPSLEQDIDYARKMKEILCEYLDEAKRVLKL